MPGRKIKWGLVFTGDNLSLADILRYARDAEAAGAESLWSTELGRDAFVPLAAIANVVKRVRLGTGVATFARPPMHTETAAMTLAELTGNRFVLGLGTAPPAWNLNWHGLAVQRPVARMRDYVACIRAMWRSNPTTPVSYEGEELSVCGYRRFIPAPFPTLPIFLAAVQPNMLKLAGEVADGLLGNLLNTTRYIETVVHPNLKQGMAKAGRAWGDFELATLKVCAVDRDRKAARDLARHTIAFYATLPYFDVVLDPAGFGAEKERIRAAFARDDVAAMLNAVSEDMVDALVIAGTPDEARAQLRRFEGLIDTAVLYCPTFAVEPAQSRANHEAIIAAFADW
jgi:probable F420-dependent oxidoreductase